MATDNSNQNQQTFETPKQETVSSGGKGGFMTTKKAIFLLVLILIIGAAVWFLKGGLPNKYFNMPQKGELVEPNKAPQVALDPNKKEYKDQTPPNFPDFPIYPGATVEKAYKITSAPDRGFEVYWKVGGDADVKKIVSWYLTEAPKAGWQIVDKPADPSAEGEQTASFKKGQSGAFLTVENEGNGIEIVLVIPVDVQK